MKSTKPRNDDPACYRSSHPRVSSKKRLWIALSLYQTARSKAKAPSFCDLRHTPLGKNFVDPLAEQGLHGL
jgi:hypothetical protein